MTNLISKMVLHYYFSVKDFSTDRQKKIQKKYPEIHKVLFKDIKIVFIVTKLVTKK